MSTIQVRDVPDEVADVIATKAREGNVSVSAYLRQLMADHATEELRRRAMRQWLTEVADLRALWGITAPHEASGAAVVREIRDEYHRSDARR